MVSTHSDAAKLTVHIEGPAVGAGRLAVHDLALLAGGLQDAITRVALVLSGVTSLRPGRRPAEIAERTRLEVVRFGPARSAVLSLSLPEAPEPEQLVAFPPEEEDIGERALNLFLDGLSSLSGDGPLPAGWDAGVLSACWEMAAVFDRGVNRIDISGLAKQREKGWRRRAVLDPEKRAIVRKLMRGPRRERRMIHGRLSMGDFRETSLRCRVDPAIGAPIECTFTEELRDRVLRALTRHVTVIGEAALDPDNGRIRELAIEQIDLIDVDTASAEFQGFWEARTIEDLAAQQGVKPVTDVAALAADFWPPDLSVDDFLALVGDDGPRRTVSA